MASTRKRITQLLFAWLAVTVLILSTACSNPGSPSTPPPAASPAPTSQIQNPPKDLTNTSPSEKTTRSNDDLNLDSSRSSQQRPVPRFRSVDNSDTSGITDNTPSAIRSARKATGLTPEQLFAEPPVQLSNGKNELSAQQQKDLFYSASSSDGLYEQIQGLEKSVKSPAARQANARFAKRIVFASFSLTAKNSALVSVTIANPKGQRVVHSFNGQLDRNLHMRSTSGIYTVDAVCMDATMGCKTVHIRIQEKHSATANVIARNHDATLYIQGSPVGSVNNPEFDRLMHIMLNTIHDSGGPESVSTLRLVTSEVVNGASKFAVTFGLSLDERRSEQVMTWSGDLVKPQQSNQTNVLLKPVFGMSSGGIADTVREARLVRNNGKGDIQLVLIVRRGTAAAEEGTLRLTISRVQAPVRELMLN